ncbi:uncharacterized protein LOC103979457 isoform X1 [Musa acuminata AAA Group]|uniref:uncharacterized protein LOC135584230 isoform X1 n=1 Tax=Musa acuminata AAA Group TaxID=214697 RepID=UPI0031E393DE
MMMSSSQRHAYSYGDALYWDARYLADGSASFDWYQRYSALRPFVRKYVPVSARVLMVGCGNAVLSEDMVKDGYIDIMNIDISSIVIDMMRTKYAHIPQLRYMQMDVRDMSFFDDESFDCVFDKGTLDSLMCGMDAQLSASQMLEEVNRFWSLAVVSFFCSHLKCQVYVQGYACIFIFFDISYFLEVRLLRPGGIYMLITYGDPSVRIPHLNQPGCNWKIILYIIPRPGFQSPRGDSRPRSIMEPVPLTESGQLPAGFVLEDPDSHYIYVSSYIPKLLLLRKTRQQSR